MQGKANLYFKHFTLSLKKTTTAQLLSISYVTKLLTDLAAFDFYQEFHVWRMYNTELSLAAGCVITTGRKKGVLWKSVLIIFSEVVAAPLNHKWKYFNLNTSSSDIFQQLRKRLTEWNTLIMIPSMLFYQNAENKIYEGQVNTKYGQFKPIRWSVSYKILKQTANYFSLSQKDGFLNSTLKLRSYNHICMC